MPALKRQQSLPVIVQQSPATHHEDMRTRICFMHAVLDHCCHQQISYAAAGRTGTHEQDILLTELFTGLLQGREQRAGSNRGGTLDVIIEGT